MFKRHSVHGWIFPQFNKTAIKAHYSIDLKTFGQYSLLLVKINERS